MRAPAIQWAMPFYMLYVWKDGRWRLYVTSQDQAIVQQERGYYRAKKRCTAICWSYFGGRRSY